MFLLLRRWVVLHKLLLLLAAQASATEPQTSDSWATVAGNLLSVSSWHAQTMTNVSWEIPSVRQDASHIIAFTWDEEATEEAWWQADNITRAVSPLSPTSSLDDDDPIVFDDDYGTPTISDDPFPCIFRPSAFLSQSKDAFNTDANRRLISVDLADKRTWWFTATLGQERPNTTSITSGVGQASILLSEPGFYSACLLTVIGDDDGDNATCLEEECINVTVYQPPYDFLEVGGQTFSLARFTRAENMCNFAALTKAGPCT